MRIPEGSIRNKLSDRLTGIILFLAVCLAGLVSLCMLGILCLHTFEFFIQISLFDFFTGTVWNPLFTEKQFGVLPLLTGTCSVVFIAALVSVGPGFLISVYLSEYSSESFRETMRLVLEVLSGIPTVVFGFLALFWATPVLKAIVPGLPPFSAFTVGIMTGLMILPMLIYLSEAIISSVPDRYRDASRALGANRMQTLFRSVLPTAFPGLLSVFFLVIIRAVGETMIVAVAGGQQAEFGFDILAPVQTMTAFIIQVSLGDMAPDSVEYHGAFAVTAVLVLTTVALSIISRHLHKTFTRRIRG